jgi:hypothetical protein
MIRNVSRRRQCSSRRRRRSNRSPVPGKRQCPKCGAAEVTGVRRNTVERFSDQEDFCLQMALLRLSLVDQAWPSDGRGEVGVILLPIASIGGKQPRGSVDFDLVEAYPVAKGEQMPRFSFGPAMLRDDLTELPGYIEASNQDQAEALAGILMEDLRSAGAGTYNEISIHLHACLINIRNNRLELAAANIRDANDLFKEGSWYPVGNIPDAGKTD